MKKIAALLLSLLLLVGCGAKDTQPPVEQPQEPEQTVQQPVSPEKPVTPPAETVEIPVETVDDSLNTYTDMNLNYTVETRTEEGLVEDTVGYIFEYPVFGVFPAAEKVNTYYEELQNFLISYARETVYPLAAEEHTIANVYGKYEVIAADEGLQLGIRYTVSVEFANGDEQSFDRTDIFHPDTGSLLGSN